MSSPLDIAVSTFYWLLGVSGGLLAFIFVLGSISLLIEAIKEVLSIHDETKIKKKENKKGDEQ